MISQTIHSDVENGLSYEGCIKSVEVARLYPPLPSVLLTFSPVSVISRIVLNYVPLG